MLISEQKRFIFIHIQKTAGISVEAVLKANVSDVRRWHGRHGRAVDGVHELGSVVWANYFRFAFVRNPWARLVSWYAMIEKAYLTLTAEQLRSDKPFKSELWNYAIKHSRDFETFLYVCTDVVFDLGCHKSFAFNQLDYLTDGKGRMSVDYVGRFESIEEDFASVGEHLKLSETTLPKLNQTEYRDYREWYTPDLQKLVAQRFARDIDAFGYRFEN